MSGLSAENYVVDVHFGRREFERPWVQLVQGYVLDNNRNGFCIGSCDAYLIDRALMTDFYGHMEAYWKATGTLAFTAFDRHGRLKPEYKEHEVKKGSGVWGGELDTGHVLLFTRIQITEASRRQGHGQRRIRGLVGEVDNVVEGPLFAMAYTDILAANALVGERYDPRIGDARIILQSVFKDFLRAAGFRRIRVSQYFALAADANHPCHQLPGANDVDPPAARAEKVTPAGIQLMQRALIWTDEALLSSLQGDFASLSAEDARWRLNSKALSAAWIISRSPVLLEVRNDAGDTPLQALRCIAEENRVKVEMGNTFIPCSDDFKGFPATAVATMVVLQGMNNPAEVEKIRLKHGCTCGECIKGYLSPRMRLSMMAKARACHDIVSSMLNLDDTGAGFVARARQYLKSDILSGRMGILSQRPYTGLRETMKTDLSLCAGFVDFFSCFSECLENSNIPNVAELSNMASPNAQRVFAVERAQMFGSCIGSTIFEMAMNADAVAGFGPRDVDVELQGRLAALPECRNDLEYGFVSAMCEYKTVSRRETMQSWKRTALRPADW